MMCLFSELYRTACPLFRGCVKPVAVLYLQCTSMLRSWLPKELRYCVCMVTVYSTRAMLLEISRCWQLRKPFNVFSSYSKQTLFPEAVKLLCLGPHILEQLVGASCPAYQEPFFLHSFNFSSNPSHFSWVLQYVYAPPSVCTPVSMHPRSFAPP